MWRSLSAAARALFRPRQAERDLDEELRGYLEMLVRDKMAEGLEPEEARRRARLEMGALDALKDNVRDAGWENLLDSLVRDVVFGARLLRRNPGFTIAVVLTLALGIGANTAIFSIVNAVLLRSLPYPDAARLVVLNERSNDLASVPVSYPNLVDWTRENRSFAELGASVRDSFNLVRAGEAERLPGRWVTASFFSTLGVRPVLGRSFGPADDRPGANPAVVLSHDLWRRQFASDRKAIGTQIILNDRPFTVIGVLPEGFWFYGRSDVFAPIRLSDAGPLHNREQRSGIYAIGRLKPGVALPEAGRDMDRVAQQLAQAYPKANRGYSVSLRPLYDDAVGYAGGTLYVLLAAVALVFLVACANVATLVLTHTLSREREIAVRSALGASRARLTRQVLTEGLLLAGLGGGLGVLLANSATRVLVASMPGVLPRLDEVRVDGGVLLFTLLGSLVASLLIGLAPALSAGRTSASGALQRRSDGGAGTQLHKVLVAGEVCLAFVLLAGAGLIVRTMLELNRVELGFDTRGTAVLNVALSEGRYHEAAEIRRYYDELLRKVGAMPGVSAAAVNACTPMWGDTNRLDFFVEGRDRADPRQRPSTIVYIPSPGYLRTMGIRLLRGRFFSTGDTLRSTLVVVIDEAFARAILPGRDPIGQRIVIPFTGLDGPREIVGVVKHVKHFGLAEGDRGVANQMYLPLAQLPDQFMPMLRDGLNILVRARGDVRALLPALRRTIAEVDPQQPVYGVTTLQDVVEGSIANQRLATLLLGAFAIVAVTLAALGTFGVVSYATNRRRHEVGIRMALGAESADVVRLLLRQGATVVVAGAAAGLVLSIGLTRALSSLLFGVTATDPVTFVAVTALVVAVGLLACYVPTRRATRVDPTTVLRTE